MDKRYQIFISSTYTDLREERARVIQTIMEMDCIPAGMELFPAADEDQWNFIKRIIDDCDYYLLIIGGRYGSLTPEGVSYTEKEHDYAVDRGLKVVALIHDAPELIPSGKTDRSPEAIEKLGVFRDKVSRGRLVKFWTGADQLAGLVALSLGKTIKTYPTVGWVRANTIANTEALNELNTARKRVSELEAQVAKLGKDITELRAAEYDGRTFEDLGRILAVAKVAWTWPDGTELELSLAEAIVAFAETLAVGVSNAKVASESETDLFSKIATPLLVYGLTDFLPAPPSAHWQRIGLTTSGRRFVAEARARIDQYTEQQRVLKSLLQAASRAIPPSPATAAVLPSSDDARPPLPAAIETSGEQAAPSRQSSASPAVESTTSTTTGPRPRARSKSKKRT